MKKHVLCPMCASGEAVEVTETIGEGDDLRTVRRTTCACGWKREVPEVDSRNQRREVQGNREAMELELRVLEAATPTMICGRCMKEFHLTSGQIHRVRRGKPVSACRRCFAEVMGRAARTTIPGRRVGDYRGPGSFGRRTRNDFLT